MSNDVSENTQALYAGGNEVFFSFLLSLYQQVEEGQLPAEGIDAALRQWASSWASRAGLTGRLERDLDQLSDALAALGLVRVFAPARTSDDEEHKVLVLRCHIGRYVSGPLIQAGFPRRCALAPIVEGALAAGGTNTRVKEERAGMLRADECTLVVNPGEPR